MRLRRRHTTTLHRSPTSDKGLRTTIRPNQEIVVETHLIAGPPPASPPLIIAVLVVALSIAAPFIFLRDGTPSLILGIAALAIALAGIITFAAAVRAQIRRGADSKARRRATITPRGIILHPTLAATDSLYFPWDEIAAARLTPSALIIHAGKAPAKPGRYAVRFGKLATPRPEIIAALSAKPDKA